MQLLKNKKFIIACIAVVAVILITIVAIVLGKKLFGSPKKYEGGEMTLVDTIGKDSGYAADVYITKNQDIILEIENAEYSGFYLESTEEPVYDFSQTLGEKENSIRYTINIYTNHSDKGATLPSGVKFPCKCKLVMVSERLGIEYSIDLKVDQEIEYKKGVMTTKEPLSASVLEGYEEYVKQYGEIHLPDDAIVLSFGKRGSDFIANDGTDIILDVCTYLHDNTRKEIWATSASNKALVEASFADAEPRKLVVNDVEVGIIADAGRHLAFYTLGDTTFINPSVYRTKGEDTEVSDDVLIKALEPFIVK